MALTSRQKKYIRKKIKKMPLEKIAVHLGISQEIVAGYVQKRWQGKYTRKEKAPRVAAAKTSLEQRIFSFKFKDWFKENWLKLVFLTLLSSVVYVNGLNSEFVADDVYSFVKNKQFGEFNQIFSSPPIFLRLLIYFFIKNIFGRAPIFYRLLNLFFHLGCVSLLYFLISHLINQTVAFFASSIMAVHPILTEAVTWISGGTYSQSAFFVLASFLFFLFSRKDKKYFYLSLLSFLLALFTSEKAMSFPFILLAFLIVFEKVKPNLKKLIPFFITTVIWMAIYMSRIPRRVTDLQAISPQKSLSLESLFEIPIAITSYLELIFWPKNLSLYHSEMHFNILEVVIRSLGLLLFLAIVLISFKKNRKIFFWLSFFVLSLLPTLIPGVSWIVAERYAYLGSLGIFVVLGMGLAKLTKKKEWKPVAYGFFALIIMALSWRTVKRNADWKNQDTLWLAAAKTSPSSPQNHNNLGDLYGRRGEYEKAIEEFKKAIALRPGYADAYHNLANSYQNLGKTDLAIENYQKALEFKPSLWQSYQNLGAIFFAQEDYGKAEAHFQKAVQFNPESSELRTNLAVVYFKNGKLQEAKKALEEALRLDPENQKAKSLLLQLSAQ